MVGIGGPNEGLGFAVVLAEMAVDRRLQVDERVEDAALQSPSGKCGVKALDGIGPGAGGGGEMEHPPGMPREPGAPFARLVDSVVVEDCVAQFAGWHRRFDPVEEADEFLMAVGDLQKPRCFGGFVIR